MEKARMRYTKRFIALINYKKMFYWNESKPP